MKIPEQITRIGLVIVLVVAGVVVARFYLVPPSLVSTDIQQATAIAREVAKPVKFVGSIICQDCHDDISIEKAKGYHRNLACEGCHGPATKHAEDPMETKPFAPRERKFCPLCHTYDAARPTGFPQINPVAHNPLKPCVACHNPHDPIPSRVPKACSACHAHIERTKSVSSHALLTCTTCHTVPEKHKTEPRNSTPSTPQTREFCGKCHDAATKTPEAPPIELATHGQPYLCWQCHYPHLPEGRG